jgi:predicted DNA-binding protein
MSDLFQLVKGLNKDEAIRIAAMELANQLNNFRNDLSRSTEKVVKDAKRIEQYLTLGT